MKEFFPVLHTAALFSGISDEELAVMLSCLGARISTFPKGFRLLRAGESVEEVGLVLAGRRIPPRRSAPARSWRGCCGFPRCPPAR